MNTPGVPAADAKARAVLNGNAISDFGYIKSIIYSFKELSIQCILWLTHYSAPDQTTTRNTAMTIKAINVRNQFKGIIKEVIEGPVVSEIDVQTASGIVTSVITTRSVHELELKVGSEVIAFVKSTEVSIAKL